MTARLTIMAAEALNLTAWANADVLHESEEAAYAALETDALTLVGKEVYVENMESDRGTITYPRPVRATVTGSDARRGWVNVNDDSEFVYLDPYVDVRLLEPGFDEGGMFTFSRSHKWRKNKP